MNELALVQRSAEWQKLKPLVLDSVSSPITKRVYNMALDEFFAWYDREPRPGFSKVLLKAGVRQVEVLTVARVKHA